MISVSRVVRRSEDVVVEDVGNADMRNDYRVVVDEQHAQRCCHPINGALGRHLGPERHASDPRKFRAPPAVIG